MAIMRLFNNKQSLMFIQSNQGTRPDQEGWLDSQWLEEDSNPGPWVYKSHALTTQPSRLETEIIVTQNMACFKIWICSNLETQQFSIVAPFISSP